MRRLKIVHLIDLAKVGGVESMFADFIQATPPSGLEVEHYTIVDSPELAPRFRDSVAKHSRLLASPKTLGPFKLPRRPYWMRARRRLALIRRCRPDLVIARNQFTDFRVAALKLGCPLIYYEHGMSWYDHSPRQLAGFLPYVTGAIAVSQAARRMLELKHHLQVPIDVCLNPLPTRLLPPATAAGRTLPTNRPLRLGMAARLVPLKAVGLLILAVKKLREQGVQVEALDC
ncbi:glycosyltransferase [Paludibacterium denitrificans]|uniref:Glycosyltransferase n=1 Tax=Paludibacterium denitrificans TaxID=2675226 RepID=A0A844GDL4_9NEIS|nr:glycosyltransferase [Paludibacterium denitrificans]MTD33318.1 glycosyltransferase [Paludibacterium denitrificans]